MTLECNIIRLSELYKHIINRRKQKILLPYEVRKELLGIRRYPNRGIGLRVNNHNLHKTNDKIAQLKLVK